MQPEFVVVPVIFGAFAFIVWTITTNIRRAKVAGIVADMHSKILEKCSASQELMGYVQSDAGRRFLESTAINQSNPAGRVLNAVQIGTILALLGGAIMMINNMHRDSDVREFFMTVGALSLAAGLGFLISAALSYVLCKSWGLISQADAKS
jgi:hypothetical protein